MKRMCITVLFLGIILMGCSPSVKDTKPTPDTVDKVEAVSTSSPEVETVETETIEIETSTDADISDFVFDDKVFSFGSTPLVNILFNTDSIQMEEVRKWADVTIDDNTVYVLANLINYYEPETLMSYVSVWGTSEDSMKNALAVFVGKDVISRDSYVKAGADGEELDKILEELGYDN